MRMQNCAQKVLVPFEEALAVALEIAATSPSSHNCQPWALARMASAPARRAAMAALTQAGADDAGEFLVLASDRTRELSALPAHHTEMRISCGLYWRLLLRALAAQGWTVRQIVAPRSADISALGLPDTWTPLRLAQLRCDGAAAESLADLRTNATARQTNRGPYRAESIPSTVLDALAPQFPATEFHLRYLHTPAARNRFAAFVARHGGRDFAHRAAWRETYSYIRHSEAEAITRGDGFTLAQLFGPLSPAQQLLRRVILAPPTMAALGVFGFPRLLAGQLAAIVRQSPVVVIVSAPMPDSDLVAAGEFLADFLLQVTDAGLVAHPVSIVIQHDDLRRRLETEFEVPGRTCFIARLGYPTTHFGQSPRRGPTAPLRTR